MWGRGLCGGDQEGQLEPPGEWTRGLRPGQRRGRGPDQHVCLRTGWRDRQVRVSGNVSGTIGWFGFWLEQSGVELSLDEKRKNGEDWGEW